MTLLSADFLFRPATPEDLGYIIDSWLKTYHRFSVMAMMDRSTFYDWYKPKVKSILSKSNVLIVCSKDDADLLVGWLCYQSDCLHYSVVRADFRHNGVFGALVERVGNLTSRSHHTKYSNVSLAYRPDLAESTTINV